MVEMVLKTAVVRFEDDIETEEKLEAKNSVSKLAFAGLTMRGNLLSPLAKRKTN